MEVLNAEAAVLDNATSLLALLGYLASKVREVRRFRQEPGPDQRMYYALASFPGELQELTDVRSKAEFANCLRP